MNLVQELGLNYFLDRFQRSMFLDPEGRPAYVDHSGRTTRSAIAIASVEGPVTKPTVVEGMLPYRLLQGLVCIFCACPRFPGSSQW